ncbi:MAG: XylR family transcriptional regulator [Roseimicrobium sp.]
MISSNIKRPQVALLIESSRAYGRGLLRGIARYVREHGPWSIYYQERRQGDAPPSWLRDWSGDGIIARVDDREMVRAIQRRGVPAVDLRGLFSDLDMPLIETDDEEVVKQSVEHLRARGFRQFAYCGFPGTNYSDKRERMFVQRLQALGLPCEVFAPSKPLRSGGTFAMEQHGLVHDKDVSHWLAQLPQPIGLLCCNDIRGQQVLGLCRQLGLAVPDEIAVLGIDNDEVHCELADPPLSSVIMNTGKIGYEAAALLAGMMKGAPPPAAPRFVPPKGIATRRSTDVLAIADRQVATAVRFIREHGCMGIQVSDVLQAVPLSRSSLERRFAAALHRTPKEEILRVQMQRAKDLLVATDFSLAEIANKTGFKHAEYLNVIFKIKTGQTPGQYRAASQHPGTRQ